MMKRMLARAGIGGTKAYLELLKTAYADGETVTGYIRVVGGGTTQLVERMTVTVKQRSGSFPLAAAERSELEIMRSFTVAKGEEKQFPFVYKLPLQEVEEGQAIFEFVTTLHIANALNDRDTVEITIKQPSAARL